MNIIILSVLNVEEKVTNSLIPDLEYEIPSILNAENINNISIHPASSTCSPRPATRPRITDACGQFIVVVVFLSCIPCLPFDSINHFIWPHGNIIMYYAYNLHGWPYRSINILYIRGRGPLLRDVDTPYALLTMIFNFSLAFPRKRICWWTPVGRVCVCVCVLWGQTQFLMRMTQ